MRISPSLAAIAALLACPVGALAQTQDLPDLTVQSHSAANGKVTAVIANTGKAGASVRTTATLYVYQDGKTHSTNDQSIPALAPGASITLNFPLPIARGVYQVMADSKRELTEASETNNRTRNADFGASDRAPTGVGSVKVTGPITGPAPDTLKILFKPDTRLQNQAASRPRMTAEDGSLRPLAASRMPSGSEVFFVENELALTSKNPVDAQGVVARRGGKILQSTDLGPDIGTLYIIRVDTSKPADVALDGRERKTPFSSEAAYNLLTIARAEHKAGLSIGVNPLMDTTGIMEGKTSEGGGNDALSLDYMQKGGVYNVDVATAWKMLGYTGKFNNKINLGILDGGFAIGNPNWLESDINVAIANSASGPNQSTCTAGSPCPWHGLNVAETAAGIPDDGRGAAGPAGPVARLLLWDKMGSDTGTAIARLKFLRDNGAQIINMSFGSEAERDESFWEGAWIDIVETFESVTRDMAFKQNRLLFAAAGNVGKNVDAKNGDGDENIWFAPCENQGVVCVGGWYEATGNNKSDWGTRNWPDSNYSAAPSGETVDIYGPWCTMVGDYPAVQDDPNSGPGKAKGRKVCGSSVSSPFVAGVAALIWAGNPKLGAQDVWALMNKHAIVAGSIRRVHAAGAVREAMMSTGEKFPPFLKLTAKTTGAFSQGATLQLTHEDFDVEDLEGCCAAQWFVDDKLYAATNPNAQSPVLKMAGLLVGTHTLKVTITDKDGLSTSQSATFIVTNAPPVVEVEAMSTQIFTGLPYEFRAKITDDGFMLPLSGPACDKVMWTSTPADMTPPNPKGCAIMPHFSTPGPHTLKAAWADALNTGAAGSVNFTVQKAAKVGIAIVKPGAGYAFNSEEPINYVAEVVNGQGGKTNVAWTLTDTKTNVTRPLPLKIGNDKTFTFEKIFPEYSGSTAGRDYVLTATAVNPNGDKASHSIPLHQMAFIK